jgi:4-hydroxy-tetrahydrodipicolinate synthase
MQISASMPKDFLLLSGDDLLTKALMSIGGSGVISVLANAFPQTFRNLTQGDHPTALQATFSLLQLNSLMYLEGNPVGIKNLLFQMGIIAGDQVRLPMLRASLELGNQIKTALQN